MTITIEAVDNDIKRKIKFCKQPWTYFENFCYFNISKY